MNAVFWFGTLIAVISACVSVPQTVRLIVTRNVAGLSITSYVAWMLSWALWAAYSLSAGAYPKAASEALGFVMEAVLLVTVCVVTGRAGLMGVLRGVAYASPGLALIAAAGMAWGPVAFAVTLTLFDAAYLIPQIRAVITAPSLEGVSLWSYGLRFLTASGWIGYGIGLGRPEVGGWGYIIAPFAVYVFVRVWMSRNTVPVVSVETVLPARIDPSAAPVVTG